MVLKSTQPEKKTSAWGHLSTSTVRGTRQGVVDDDDAVEKRGMGLKL